MMKRIALLLALSLLAVCVSAVAEGSHNGGRGNGTGGGSMQTLNEGIACMNGDGAEQDYDKALQLFLKACEAGSMKAARYVGMIYEQGLGVEQDLDKAITLYQEAAADESQEAIDALVRLNIPDGISAEVG